MGSGLERGSLKVTQIIPQLGMGGGEVFTIALCNELASFGVDVQLVVFHEKQRTAVERIGLDDSVRVIGLGKRPGLDLLLLLRIWRLFFNERPDVLNTHLRALYYVLPASLALGIRCFHTVHSLADKEEPGFLGRKLKWVCFHRRWARAITISSTVDDSVGALYGSVPRIRIENGAVAPLRTVAFDIVKEEVGRYRRSPSTLVFVSVGSIRPEKNQLLLLDAFAELYREGADVVLLLIGGEPGGGRELIDRLQRLKAPNTAVLGNRGNVGDYFSLADAFCLSSLYEGMPIALLEAMSVGLVPLCTPVGGMADVLRENGVGYLSRDLTVKSYLDILHEFCNLSLVERRAMALKCKNVIQERYSMRSVAMRYLEAYQQSVNWDA